MVSKFGQPPEVSDCALKKGNGKNYGTVFYNVAGGTIMDAWLAVLISFLTSATVTSGLQFLIPKLIVTRFEHRNQKALEAYKSELNRVSEQQKFNYQRWITDFSLFTQKKHETYAKLYRLILIADGSLETLSGFRQVPSFDEYTRSDMGKYLHNYQIVEGYIPELLNGWENSRETCIQKIRGYLTMIDFQKADKARSDAKNYFLVNTLYLSEATEHLISELLSLLVRHYVIDRQSLVEHCHDRSAVEELKTIREQKLLLLAELKTTMRNEISVGHYSENPCDLSPKKGKNAGLKT
jgi:hypothetical protein